MKITVFASSLASGEKSHLWVKPMMAFIASASPVDADGKIEHVFDDFKTSNHHDIVLKWVQENA